MKKVLLVLFSVALLLSIAGVATAAEPSPGFASGEKILSKVIPQDSVTVYYSAEETYSVTIPEYVRFGPTTATKTVITEVTADTVVLDSGKVLNLSVSSKHSWHMCQHNPGPGGQETADESKYIPYSLTYTLDGVNSIILKTDSPGPASVMLVPTGTDEKKTTLTFNMLADAPETGTYKDNLIFTVAIESA